MPQRRSGIQELRLNRKKRMHNLDIKTALKKTIKKLVSSVDSKNKSDAEAGLKIVYKKIDKAAKRNIMNKNTASRRKSHFNKLVKNISA